MKKYNQRQPLKIFFWWLIPVLLTLGVVFIGNSPAYNQQVQSSCRPQIVSTEERASTNIDDANLAACEDSQNLVTSSKVAFSELAKANIVYLGENHDSAEEHQTQLAIIQELQKRNSKVAIAMEMFQRPYQDVLDRYLAGQLNEQQLLKQSQYEQRWGFPWEYYAPILRFAKEKQLPVLALNTPTEVTRQVAREGLESLNEQQRQYIPSFSEIRTDNAEYRQMLLAAFNQHQQGGHGNSANFERFFLAQVLWDETMAETIAQFVKTKPDYQVVVLAGQGHIVYGYGIPSRVARRLGKIVQRSVLFSAPEDASGAAKPIADFIWQQ